MTKLERKVARETAARVHDLGESRPVIVSLEPPDILAFRLKGTRRVYRLTAGYIYRLAVQEEVARDARLRKFNRMRAADERKLSRRKK